MERIQCPQCGGGIITREMWGWVHPVTGKYVSRFIGFRFDTLFLSSFMFVMGVLYAAFYLVAVPVYLLWRLITHRKYTVRRNEYICEECNHHWSVDKAK